MHTQHAAQRLSFKGLGDRRVEAQFSAERITTDFGGLLLREVAVKMDLLEKTSSCFTDYRDPDRREHETQELLAQKTGEARSRLRRPKRPRRASLGSDVGHPCGPRGGPDRTGPNPGG